MILWLRDPLYIATLSVNLFTEILRFGDIFLIKQSKCNTRQVFGPAFLRQNGNIVYVTSRSLSMRLRCSSPVEMR